MKQIKIKFQQISRKTGEILREGTLTYESLKSALTDILDFHNHMNEYEATYIEFAPFVEEEI